jgi:hypothetical protein
VCVCVCVFVCVCVCVFDKLGHVLLRISSAASSELAAPACRSSFLTHFRFHSLAVARLSKASRRRAAEQVRPHTLVA